MPINMYVAPKDGTPHWWQVTDHEGLSFEGSFPWAATEMPPDHIRHDGYRVPYEEEVATWRPASRDEAVCIVWDLQIKDET